MRADGQDAWQRFLHVNWKWSVASCPSKHGFAAADDACDRVVHVANDSSVMNQKIISNAVQSDQRILIAKITVHQAFAIKALIK